MAIAEVPGAVTRELPAASSGGGFEALLALDQAVLDALPSAVSVCAADGVIVRYNRRAVELWGRTPRFDERFAGSLLIHRTDGRIVAPTETPMARVLATGEPARDSEMVIQRPDGSRISVLVNIEPFRTASGKVLGAIASLVDISERKRAEEALKRSEESLARRAAEQAALYRLSLQLQRAQSLEQIYEAALDSIIGALNCNRASILLYDEGNVMRFAAWRGLSDDYRASVEAHSPWALNAKDPVPVTIEDAAAADISRELKETLKREGIGALAFIPLVANGVLIGKFMTYYAAPHRFSADEIELALAFARHVAFGVARTRGQEARRLTQEALARNEERLRLATQSGKIGIWEWNIGSNRLSWTDSLYAIHGVNKEVFEATVEAFRALVHADDNERVDNAIKRSLSDDVPFEIEFRAVRPDGQIVWVFTNAMVLKEGDKPQRMLGVTLDITERKEAEAQREFLVAELNHRVKNTLATVISIAHQSFRDHRGPGIDEARRSFDARIRALGQTHSRLADSNWQGVPFEKLLADEIAPYANADGGNVRMNGPKLTLNPKCAVSLGMAIHELTTNAAKHGAFTAKNGAVDVGWEMDRKEKQVLIKWIESGGPIVEPPKRSGFGRLLLERALAADLKGKVELNFARDGLTCTIAFPFEEPSPPP